MMELPGDVQFEFGGPSGALFSIIMMPLTVFYLTSACNKESCNILRMPSLPENWGRYFDAEAAGIYLTWLIFQVSLHLLLTGKVAEGKSLVDGKKLKYTCNGFLCFLASVAAFCVSVYVGHDVTVVCDKLPGILATATVLAFLFSIYLYLRSYGATPEQLSPGGYTGSPVYDFHLGRELNPRLGDFDLKFFCELRPGLIGWIMVDLCFLVKDYKESGSINVDLFTLIVFHALYVVDALYFEESVLTTLDITSEGFGFMLVFGDLVWVPGIFSLQAQYLALYPQRWSTLALLLIIAANSVGYLIFRSANNEKDLFRRDPKHPNVRSMETIQTEEGSELLVSSWWGTVRHPNYLGDVIMATSWTVLCGFSHILPWYYLLYLCGTLAHRCGRDHLKCARKYGSAWDMYCERVQRKIIPGIF